MTFVGLWLVALVVLFVFALVVDGVRYPAEWVRRCPVCHRELRRPYGDRSPFTCPNCDWVGF